MANHLSERTTRIPFFRLPEALTCWPAVSWMMASFPGRRPGVCAGRGPGPRGWGSRCCWHWWPSWWGWPASAALAPACQTWRASAPTGVCGLLHRRVAVPAQAAGRRAADDAGGAGPVPGPGRGVFICKIPVLGPLLLVVVVPVAVLAMAALMLALYVASSIVGPALWDGERVMHSLCRSPGTSPASTRLPPSARSWAACCCRPSFCLRCCSA